MSNSIYVYLAAIDDLRNKRDRLRDQLRDAEIKFHAALIAEFPKKVGQRWRDSKGHIGQISRLKVGSYRDEIETLVKLVRKDGSLGREKKMYVWEKWERICE